MPNIEPLLQPISADHPSGEDMSFSAEFDTIKQARVSDDPKLEQGDWETDLKEADWSLVSKTAEKLLTEKTKDLRVIGWLIEGWTKTQGFAGLAAGMDVLSGICKNFWETLYPRVDGEEEEGTELRAGNVAWIVDNLIELAKAVPLTRVEGGMYGYLFWEAAMKLANDIKRSPNDAVTLSKNRLTLEEFNVARTNTPPAFYKDLYQHVLLVEESTQNLVAVLNETMGNAAPSLTPFKQLSKNILDLVRRFAREAGVLIEDEPAEETSGDTENASHEKPASIGGAIASRKQALDQLRAIAAYFRETEPHSPVAYLAEKAA
ncbi:MAG: type VI secretion system protein TssA, partial [Burkholderiales bacterium]|nr:type VI secretion system protein TssA [Burkholderiales bacterium]